MKKWVFMIVVLLSGCRAAKWDPLRTEESEKHKKEQQHKLRKY